MRAAALPVHSPEVHLQAHTVLSVAANLDAALVLLNDLLREEESETLTVLVELAMLLDVFEFPLDGLHLVTDDAWSMLSDFDRKHLGKSVVGYDDLYLG